jgi:hypothetical protein
VGPFDDLDKMGIEKYLPPVGDLDPTDPWMVAAKFPEITE